MNQSIIRWIRAPRDGARSRETEQGSAGRTRAPQFESESFGTDLGPAGPNCPRRTNQDTGTDRAPRDEPGPRRTNQSLWDTIRALVDGPEPR